MPLAIKPSTQIEKLIAGSGLQADLTHVGPVRQRGENH